MNYLALLALALPAALATPHGLVARDTPYYSISAHETVCWQGIPSGLILGSDVDPLNIPCADSAPGDPLWYSLGYASDGCSFTLYEDLGCTTEVAFIPVPAEPDYNGCLNLPSTGPGFRSLSVQCESD